MPEVTQRSVRELPALRLLPAVEPAAGPSLCEALPRHLVVADGEPGPEWAGLPAPGLVLSDPPPRLESAKVPGEDAPPAAPPASPVTGFGLTARERRTAGKPLAVLGTRLVALAAERPVLIAAGTLGEAERVRDLLAEAGMAIGILEPKAIATHRGPLALTHAPLSAGFLDAESGFLVLTSADLFGLHIELQGVQSTTF